MCGSSVISRVRTAGACSSPCISSPMIVVAIPALMAEMLIGRHGGKSAIGTMNVLVARDGIAPLLEDFWGHGDDRRVPDPQLLLRHLRLDGEVFRLWPAGRLQGNRRRGRCFGVSTDAREPRGHALLLGSDRRNHRGRSGRRRQQGDRASLRRADTRALDDPDLPAHLFHRFRGYRCGLPLPVHHRLDPLDAGGGGDGGGAGVLLAGYRRGASC